LGIDFSVGKVNDSLKAVSMALRAMYLEVKDVIKVRMIFNINDTFFRINKKKVYTWVFLTKELVLFKNGARSKLNLEEVLGKSFEGIIGCDCYGSYFSFTKDLTNAILQLCWATF
jgi:hypothetical protein